MGAGTFYLFFVVRLIEYYVLRVRNQFLIKIDKVGTN